MEHAESMLPPTPINPVTSGAQPTISRLSSAKSGPVMREITVGDVMSHDVAVCYPETDVYYVSILMDDRNIGAVPVVEDVDSLKPVGMVTKKDIAQRIDELGRPGHLVREAMTRQVYTVTPQTPLETCLRKMESHQIRRIAVVDERGRCCGIIADADVTRARTAPVV